MQPLASSLVPLNSLSLSRSPSPAIRAPSSAAELRSAAPAAAVEPPPPPPTPPPASPSQGAPGAHLLYPGAPPELRRRLQPPPPPPSSLAAGVPFTPRHRERKRRVRLVDTFPPVPSPSAAARPIAGDLRAERAAASVLTWPSHVVPAHATSAATSALLLTCRPSQPYQPSQRRADFKRISFCKIIRKIGKTLNPNILCDFQTSEGHNFLIRTPIRVIQNSKII